MAQADWIDKAQSLLIRCSRSPEYAGITAESALDLAEALGTSPKLWMNLQATFDLNRTIAARDVA